LEFRILSNLFEFIQITTKIFKRNLKPSFKIRKLAQPTDLAWPPHSSHPGRQPAHLSFSAQKAIWPSEPHCPALTDGAFHVYVFHSHKCTQQNTSMPRPSCLLANAAHTAQPKLSPSSSHPHHCRRLHVIAPPCPSRHGRPSPPDVRFPPSSFNPRSLSALNPRFRALKVTIYTTSITSAHHHLFLSSEPLPEPYKRSLSSPVNSTPRN
jgi:hypothetical protein